MKKVIFLLIILLFIACKKESNDNFSKAIAKTPIDLGKEIFEGKGNCVACHQPEQKIVGPSIQDIAKTYKEKNASIIIFLKGNAEPLVDPSQYDVMKTNFAITKQMTDAELHAVEAYMNSFLK